VEGSDAGWPQPASRSRPAERPTSAQDQRYSRWQRSEVTFGPVGRILASFVVQLPLIWLIDYSGIIGIVIGVPVAFKVLPWAYGDIWRKVRVRSTPADELSSDYRQTFPEDAPPRTDIGTRRPPRRW
jgi:hypothetical protein